MLLSLSHLGKHLLIAAFFYFLGKDFGHLILSYISLYLDFPFKWLHNLVILYLVPIDLLLDGELLSDWIDKIKLIMSNLFLIIIIIIIIFPIVI